MAGPNFAITSIANQVLNAEARVIEQSDSLARTLHSVRSRIEGGHRLNELGELQSQATQLDTSIGRLEEAAAAFDACVTYRMEEAASFNCGNENTDQVAQQQLWDLIRKSQRLQNIMTAHNREEPVAE